jgi:hypothetical protein
MGDDYEALIVLAASGDPGPENLYYMKYEGGRWKLGALTCELDIPDTFPKKHLIAKFRQPKFESERKLDEIVRLVRRDSGIFPFAMDLSWRDTAHDRQFAGLFTADLLRKWKRQAKASLDVDCQAGYFETGKGGCDLTSNPIVCGVEEIDLETERTTVESGSTSIITYTRPGNRPTYRYRFRVIHEADGWKLDGVDCGASFIINTFE